MYASYRWQCGAPVALVIGVAVFLSGCWTPPSADASPTGKRGVIEHGIEVQRVLDSARVESLNRLSRTARLSAPGVPSANYDIGKGVRNWGDIRIGDRVHARIEEVLTLYVARANERRGSGDERRGSRAAARSPSPDARVLLVDPSYRLLEVQYPNGETETFKIGLHTPMSGIEAGDFVAIRDREVIELRVRHSLVPRPMSRTRAGAASAS